MEKKKKALNRQNDKKDDQPLIDKLNKEITLLKEELARKQDEVSRKYIIIFI